MSLITVSLRVAVSTCVVAGLLAMTGSGIAQGLGDLNADRNALPSRLPKPRLPEKGVLFFDDFQRDTIGTAWTVDRDGAWSIRHGMLRGDLPDKKQLRALIRAGSPDWTDYAVDLDVCMMRGVDKGVIVRVSGDAGIAVDLRGPGYGDVVIQRSRRAMGKASVLNGNGRWHHLRVEARGNTYNVYVDRQLVLEARDKREPLRGGRIALPAYTGGGGKCTVYYDNVLVTSLK